ncbi:MAG: molybdenum cofactor biosynthesis protein MoaB [Myxococcales bacterium]|nr:molybdenum cofactor biosynthesis protein MoaB [Myxococcales bacterium]
MSTSTHEHKKEAPKSVAVYVLTVSDTRTVETDKSGALIKELLVGAGHRVSGHEIVPDEADEIRAALMRQIAHEETEAIVITGGTGIGPRDVTIEVVDSLLDKRMPGFGELFRVLSYEEIGAATVLSRATGGVAGGTIVLATPGSSGAVRLAMSKIILPELAHMIREIRNVGKKR